MVQDDTDKADELKGGGLCTSTLCVNVVVRERPINFETDRRDKVMGFLIAVGCERI